MSRTSKNTWTPEQVTALVELIVEHGAEPMSVVASLHNQRFGVRRTVTAVEQQYRRLREIYDVMDNKKAMKLIKAHPKLFRRVPRKDKQRDAEVQALRDEVYELRALLNERTDPANNLGVQ